MKNISTFNRVLRITLSLGIVVAVLNMSGPVGNLVYALFISLYVGLTASIGWDPMIALMNRVTGKAASESDHVHHDHLLHH